MFRNWGFLLGEIWVLLLIALLIGLLVGWIIWGRRGGASHDESTRMAQELQRCNYAHEEKDAHIRKLERALAQTQAAQSGAIQEAEAEAEWPDDDATDDAPDAGAGEKPAQLSGPRGGVPDNLKEIKGIGPKLEVLCHKLGFYHFDQIAAWTEAEIAWVDDNLEGFKGRVSRDEWVSQAKQLAAGEATAFSEKVKKGDMY